jgi:nucleoside-diphosphate-sugar epimerase
MNVLVTGGTGYLGARISYALSKNNKIFVQSRKKKNLNLELKNIIQFKYDWKNHSILNERLKAVDAIIHTAGTDFDFCKVYKKEAEECYLNNTDILYYYAKKNNIKKIINFSTIHVYGSQKGHIHENSDVSLDSNYAYLNFEREKLSEKFNKSEIQFTNIRLSNCFGYPILRKTNCWKLILPSICKNIIKNNNIKLKTKQDFYKNFSTIYDLCKLMRLLVYSNKKLPPILNFSSGKPKKISQLINLIIDIEKKTYNKKPLNNLEKLISIQKPERNFISNYLQKINFEFSNNYTHELTCLLKVANNFFSSK